MNKLPQMQPGDVIKCGTCGRVWIHCEEHPKACRCYVSTWRIQSGRGDAGE